MAHGKTTRYVAVYEGEGPGTSRPVIATSDPATVEAITRLIVDRVNAGLPLHPKRGDAIPTGSRD